MLERRKVCKANELILKKCRRMNWSELKGVVSLRGRGGGGGAKGAHAVPPIHDFIFVTGNLEAFAHLLVSYNSNVGQTFLAYTEISSIGQNPVTSHQSNYATQFTR